MEKGKKANYTLRTEIKPEVPGGESSMKWYLLRIAPAFMLLLLAVSARGICAESLQLLDQQGHPLVDAVVVATGVSAKPSTAAVVMDQVDRAFLPHVLSIPRGQSVSFPNSDNIRHHVYSFSETHPFEIRLYSGIPSDAVTFERPGIVVLGCNIHDNMEGYILITDGDWSRVTDENGEVEWSASLAAQAVYVWHPRQQGSINELHLLHVGDLQSRVQFPVPLVPDEPPVINSFENHFLHKND